METYKNLSGKSGILAYKVGEGHLIVQFHDGRETFYTYTHATAGNYVIDHIKALSQIGHSLNSYISTHKPSYAAKGSALMGVE